MKNQVAPPPANHLGSVWVVIVLVAIALLLVAIGSFRSRARRRASVKDH